MKRVKIIVKNKGKLEKTEEFNERYQKELEFYLNEGYEIKASNLHTEGLYAYIYTLLEKEN